MYKTLKLSGRISLDSGSEKWLSCLDNYFKCRYPCVKNPVAIGDEDWEQKTKPIINILIEKLPKKLSQYANKILKKSSYSKGNRTLFIKQKGRKTAVF